MITYSRTVVKLVFFQSLFLTAVLSGCRPPKSGITHYGKDGKIKDGKSISRCSKPVKPYTKSVEVALQLNLDSSKILKGNIEANLKEAVTKLGEYTSDGLDYDLVLWRICEISAGLPAEQRDKLVNQVREDWKTMTILRNQKPGTQLNLNQSGGTSNFFQNNYQITQSKPEIPLDNNFDVRVAPANERAFPDSSRSLIEIRPKEGVWMTPFIAVPVSEDSTDWYATLKNESIISVITGTVNMMTGNGDSIPYKIQKFPRMMLGPSGTMIFLYKSKPTNFVFGDASDTSKIYIAGDRSRLQN